MSPHAPLLDPFLWSVTYEPADHVRLCESLAVIALASCLPVVSVNNLRDLADLEARALRIELDRNEFTSEADGPGDPLGWSNARFQTSTCNEAGPPLTLARIQEAIDQFRERVVYPFNWFLVDHRRFDELDLAPRPPATVSSVQDNAAEELIALVKAGDHAGFRELASALMPVEEIEECWAGARQRLRLPVGESE